MASFFIPLTGLEADSTALNTVANNLSNMSTTAYKAQTTNFSDLFHQQIGTSGSGDAIQVGAGTQVASNTTNFTQGTFNTTGTSSSDVAMNGNGFFVVGNGTSTFYTRDGSFSQDNQGNLITSDGLNVMGYPAVKGVVNTNTALTAINIPVGKTQPAQATTSFNFAGNLDANSAIGTSFPSQITVYDSLGNSYQATASFTKTATNQWSYSVTLPDSIASAPATAAAAATIPVAEAAPTATNVTTAAAAVAPVIKTISSTLATPTPTLIATTATLAASGVIPASVTSGLVNATPAAGSLSYAFAPTGVVDATTSLKITDGVNSVTVTPQQLAGGTETVQQFGQDITAALAMAAPGAITAVATGTNGVSATNTGGTLTIVGAGITLGAGNVGITQDIPETTNNFNLVTSNGSLAQIDPTTTLGIQLGNGTSVSVPPFNAAEPLSTYAADLQTAVGAPALSGVTITGVGGQLSIKGPANMTITGNLAQNFTADQSSYSLGTYSDPTTQVSTNSTINPASNIQITGPTTAGGTATFPATANLATFVSGMAQPVSIGAYATALQNGLTAAGVTGVSVVANGTQISITGPTGMNIAGSLEQDMKGTTNVYNFNSNGTVDPSSNLTITGATVPGSRSTVSVPTITSGESVATYAADLSAAIAKAGISNVTVNGANNQLTITGANLTLGGSVSQDLADTTINYDFGPTATVNTATKLTITGPTAAGGTATIIPPTVTAGETLVKYAADLNTALTNAGIVTGVTGVSVTANGGQLSIVGPATTLSTAGVVNQDLTATSFKYSFGTNNGALATVSPKTDLTITGMAATGGTATTTAPTVTSGETMVQYATALNTALAAAGIGGVSVSATNGILAITGANISTNGSVVQDPVASAAASGTLAFDSSGNLVSPAANLAGITFSGLSDGAANLNMNWNLFSASGGGNISQTVTKASSVTGTTQDGYASGNYQSFSIGSNGTVSASYSNGQTLNVGQLALANMANLQGLTLNGNGDYATTLASGAATVGTSGTTGLGTIQDSALEESNVNISAEFSNLIIAQRAFEANAKAVTTFDTVTQDTINIVH